MTASRMLSIEATDVFVRFVQAVPSFEVDFHADSPNEYPAMLFQDRQITLMNSWLVCANYYPQHFGVQHINDAWNKRLLCSLYIKIHDVDVVNVAGPVSKAIFRFRNDSGMIPD